MNATEVRYGFGKNWFDFSRTINDDSIQSAMNDLARLVGTLKAESFFDIGSGSGLHSLAALKLGARKVSCIDYDTDSVGTTRAVLSRHADDKDWNAEQGDILGDNLLVDEQFDVVYSWGVLHHTGNMNRAITNAATYVRPGGRFIVALYLKTPFCGMWKVEKYIYSRFALLRPLIKYPYTLLLLAAHLARGRNIYSLVRNYRNSRGMSFMHDVDDWLGGYPYESITQNELIDLLGDEFQLENSFNVKQPIGLLGTGCGEWVFRRK